MQLAIKPQIRPIRFFITELCFTLLTLYDNIQALAILSTKSKNAFNRIRNWPLINDIHQIRIQRDSIQRFKDV